MNRISFAATFFCGPISLRWAQHKRRQKCATPIILSKFKAFLRKDLESSQAFIDSIWSKFKRDSQYQLEEARDWASNLQYLQSILSKFDRTPDELIMICYFWKGLKPSINVEMKQQNRESTNFEEIVQRAANAEVKAGLRSSIIVQEADAYCFRGHHPSHNTSSKVQTQGSSHKDSLRSKESKPTDLKPAPLRDNAAEPAKKKDRKEKKKRLRNHGREHPGEQTPATGVNTKAPKKKIKAKCFNYNKKSHYTNEYTKSPKN